MYLQLVERDVVIDGHKVKVHCHCLAVDGNGRVQPKRLAQFMRNAIADYAIPRSKLQEARLRDVKFRSSSAVAELHRQACAVFTDLEDRGGRGDASFLLAGDFLKLPQVAAKWT